MSDRLLSEGLGKSIAEAVLTNIDEDRMYDSIREGVQDAIWQIANHATHAPCADFYDMIKQGVKEGMENYNK